MITIIRKDWLKHFVAGLLICFVLWGLAWWWVLALLAIIAGSKELYDMIGRKGDPDAVDFLCTVAAFPVVVLIETIKNIFL